MNLHEYQSKELLKEYGLPVPQGVICETAGQIFSVLERIKAASWMVKCQVHTGGRCKSGGVKMVKNTKEAHDFALHWLGKNLITNQTGEDGQPVNKILIEPCIEYDRELYLSATIDRNAGAIVFIASQEGGVEIEQVAINYPEQIYKVIIDPISGAQPFQGRELAYKLGLQHEEVATFTKIFMQLASMVTDLDLSLVEINPLVLTKERNFMCLDAKFIVDDNALYRQPRLKAMEDLTQEDPREVHAAFWKLNYVALNGNIGCMVNGAGLAMATMDLINYYGGKSANFLDVGGGATEERVTEAFKLILSDPQIAAIIVNIFGGIVRCDTIAEGIINAIDAVGVDVPVVVRLEGNNATLGTAILEKSGLNIITANSLVLAAKKVVAATGVK